MRRFRRPFASQLAIGWILLTVAAVVCCASARAADPARVLIIGHLRDHPYETHEYLVDAEILAKCLRQTPNVEVTVSDGWPTDPATLDEVDAIVLHVASGGDFLLGGRHREAAEKLLDRGVGLTAIHWGTGAEADEPGHHYQKRMGGRFATKFSKLEHVELPLTQPHPEHVICRGWQGFPLHDEYYLDLKFEPGAVPVAEVERDGKQHPVVWAFERPEGGRSFGCVLGHYHRNFGREEFRRLLTNGILWTAKVDIPEGGAPVKIDDADMKLPPDEPAYRRQ